MEPRELDLLLRDAVGNVEAPSDLVVQVQRRVRRRRRRLTGAALIVVAASVGGAAATVQAPGTTSERLASPNHGAPTVSAAYLPPKYKLVEKSNINDDQHLLVFSPYLNKIQASAIPGGGPSITVVTVLDQTPTWPPSAVNAGTFRGGKTLLAYSPDAETSVLTWTERPGLVVRVIGVNGPDALVLRRVAEALRISD